MRGNFFLGAAVGAGAVLFGPTLWKSGRPAIKSAVRAGIEGYGVARIKAAQFAEEVEDLVAEVVYELEDEDEVAEAAPVDERAAAAAAKPARKAAAKSAAKSTSKVASKSNRKTAKSTPGRKAAASA